MAQLAMIRCVNRRRRTCRNGLDERPKPQPASMPKESAIFLKPEAWIQLPVGSSESKVESQPVYRSFFLPPASFGCLTPVS